MSLSTHVLDAGAGRPAVGVRVVLTTADGHELARRSTDAGGRVADLAGPLEPGTYRLTFDTAGYLGDDAFFPEVVVVIRLDDPAAHHHVPLLLSPYAYSTYRGS